MKLLEFRGRKKGTKGVESALNSLMVTAGIGVKFFTFDVVINERELPIRFPRLAGQYFSTSDWHD